jgi:hypothetical protein
VVPERETINGCSAPFSGRVWHERKVKPERRSPVPQVEGGFGVWRVE